MSEHRFNQRPPPQQMQITPETLLQYHAYLCQIANPTLKMQEAKAKVEDQLHMFFMSLKSGNPS